MSDSQLNVFHI